MADSQITVLVVDDHSVVREGVVVLLDLQPDMKVVASAATGEEAVELFARHRPDVTIMDLQLPGMSGLDAIRAIRHTDSDAHVIVLTMYQGEEDVYHALQAGAVTYVLKGAPLSELVHLVREVHAGRRPIPPDVAARLADRVAQAALTPREVEVIELIAKGMRNKEIGDLLGITETTAKVHVKNIFAKLNVQDRTAAVAVALRRGIIHIS